MLVGVALLTSPSAASAQLAVAAASDLQIVMPAISARYQQATGRQLRVSFGSSGQFFAQIQNGAPFDVFLSADEAYVTRLVASGHAVAGSVVPYASGRLALWARQDKGLNLANGLRGLADSSVRRIAIANPEHAPYGRASVEALRRAGVYEQVRTRLVLGENVAQAAQFAQTGNADAAVIALSLTRTPAMQSTGTVMEIPPDTHELIRQSGVVVSRASDKEAARRFLAFLTSDEIATLLEASGFGRRP
jgi:molybdate transport system substrate-binding protein